MLTVVIFEKMEFCTIESSLKVFQILLGLFKICYKQAVVDTLF